jgi:hypothetical protein
MKCYLCGNLLVDGDETEEIEFSRIQTRGSVASFDTVVQYRHVSCP